MRGVAGALSLALVLSRSVAAHASDVPQPPNLAPHTASNEDRDRFGFLVPDYVKLQTGGFLGMFTIGVGYSAFGDRLNIGASYGFVPPLNGAPRVHLFTGSGVLRPIWFNVSRERYRVYPLYLGGGLLIARGKDLFVSQPAVYPANYYPPTGLHGMLLFGSEVALRVRQPNPFTRHSVYVEFVTIDEYWDSLTNNRQFRLYDAFSTALGYRASF